MGRKQSMGHVLVASTFLCAALYGQVPVVVVDDQAGPGVNYTTLDAALAGAQDGAVVLIRDGTYTLPQPPFGAPVVLDGKTLHLVGDAQAQVSVSGSMSIRNLPGSKHFSVVNIDAMSGHYDLEACAGWTWIENVHYSSGGAIQPVGAKLSHGGPGGLIANRSVLFGGQALFDFNALQLDNSQAFLYDTTVTGGFLAIDPHFPPQQPALGLNNSFVFQSGGQPNGIVSATGDASSSIVTVGNTVTTLSGFSVPQSIELAGPTRSFETNTPVRAGQNASFTFTGPVGELAILNVALQPAGFYLPIYNAGAQIGPPLVLLQPMGVIPSGGTLAVDLPLQPHLAAGGAALVYTQASFGDVANLTIRLGGGSLLVILDPAY